VTDVRRETSPDLVNEAVARAKRDRNLAIRIQYEQQVAHGKSPSAAVRWTAYRSGLKQAQVREIVQTQQPATRRLTQPQELTV
jgi:hypothetical protein